jgi:hypothetical protein
MAASERIQIDQASGVLNVITIHLESAPNLVCHFTITALERLALSHRKDLSPQPAALFMRLRTAPVSTRRIDLSYQP